MSRRPFPTQANKLKDEVYKLQEQAMALLLELQQSVGNRVPLEVTNPRKPPPIDKLFEPVITVCNYPTHRRNAEWPREDIAGGKAAHKFNEANMGSPTLLTCGCKFDDTKRHGVKCGLKDNLLKSYRSKDKSLYGFGWKQYTVWFGIKATAPLVPSPDPAPNDVGFCIASMETTQRNNNLIPLRGLHGRNTESHIVGNSADAVLDYLRVTPVFEFDFQDNEWHNFFDDW